MRAKSVGFTVFLALLPIWVWLFVSHATAISAAPTPSSCAAVVNNGITDTTPFISVQAAIDAASNGQLIKIAGYCETSFYSSASSAYQVAVITKDLTLRGGYSISDWTTSHPLTNVTTLDGLTNTYTVRVVAGTSSFENLHIINGDAGFYQSAGAATISNSVVMSGSQVNIKNTNGAGSLIVINSLATGSSGEGIANLATATIIDTTVSHNSEGVYAYGGNTRIINSTIGENNGIGLQPDGPVVVSNTTIAGNTGEGVFSFSGIIRFRNTLLTQNSYSNCLNYYGTAAFISLDYNLSDDNSNCGLTQTHDITNVTAPVGPLQDNGGSTWTMALNFGNPAINGGACDLTTDQRGQPRPDSHSAYCDIGAYEFEGVFQHVYLPLTIKNF